MSRLDLSRLYRAHVSSLAATQPELTVFVDASSRDVAHQRIAEGVALIAGRTVSEVHEAIYNLHRAQELVEQGVSERRELRIFESSWSADRIVYVDSPLFLVSDPRPLLQAWEKTRATVDWPENCAVTGALTGRESL